jgi:hypothetical protein
MSDTSSGQTKGGFALEGYFRWAIEHHRRSGSHAYADYASRILEDPDLLAIAAQAPPGQPPTHLLFGAVHDLLFDEPDTPLARTYASIHPDAQAPASYELFRDYVLANRERLLAIMRSRTVQVTLVGRNGEALPAIAEVARRAGEPLCFVEVGCSAGITTLFDHYGYDYGTLGTLRGVAPVVVRGCRFEGTPPRIPERMPRVGRRIGIDLNPVDATDPAERRWIDALISPELVDDRRELRAALDYRARTPFELIRGDALRVLPELLPTLPDPVCIFHSHCLYQWSPEGRAAFDTLLREASRGRTLWRLGVEYPVDRPAAALQWPEHPDDLPLIDEITLVTYRDGDARSELLGRCDGWGRRAEWLGD